MMQPRTEAEIAIGAISNVIKGRLTKPIYLRASWDAEAGRLAIEQVEYLTAEEFAPLVKVEPRTVYTWFEKNLIKSYKPPGTGQRLINLNDAIEWIESGAAAMEEHQ
jgi:excisionase family DNA binding protein